MAYIYCDSRSETEGKKLILLIYHKQMKQHNSGKLWGRAVTRCHNALFGRGNSIFSLLRARPP